MVNDPFITNAGSSCWSRQVCQCQDLDLDDADQATKAGNPVLVLTISGANSSYGKGIESGHVQTYLVIRSVIRTNEGNWVIVDDPVDSQGKLKVPQGETLKGTSLLLEVLTCVQHFP